MILSKRFVVTACLLLLQCICAPFASADNTVSVELPDRSSKKSKSNKKKKNAKKKTKSDKKGKKGPTIIKGTQNAEKFYHGICGDDGDDENWVVNFCIDMFDDSPRTELNICDGPINDRIQYFCDWLEENNKSLSNRDYFLGMCDGPARPDRAFCNDIDAELCGRNLIQLSNSQIDLCEWLIDIEF